MQCRIQGGGQIRPRPPHRSWQWSLAPPSGEERIMIVLWNWRNVIILAPSYRCRLRVWPPKKNGRLKHETGRCLKNRNFERYRLNSFWEMQTFFRKMSFGQKIMICRNRSWFRQKFRPPRFWNSGSANESAHKSEVAGTSLFTGA